MIRQTTAIIPQKTEYYGSEKQLDYRAICVFCAIGFFLDTNTFWQDKKTLPTASECEIDEQRNLLSAKKYFSWFYEPREISLAKATEEFGELFEEIIREQAEGKKVILPLSGGLDSRTQAAALKNIGADVHAFSYSFCGGHDETKYSAEIAEVQNFDFESWKINSSYLWNVIDRLAVINGCYSEFTHPRQMAFIDKYKNLGEIFSLGHWGDVLFDDLGVSDDLPFEKQVSAVIKKIVKNSGLEIASALWKSWNLEGDFEDYLFERVKKLLASIDIPQSANARIRAFKSKYWAPRWTSVNLSVFESINPVTLPYYDNRMCEFICTVPEKHLAGRKIQIEYLKKRAPQLAKIIWQDQRPFNLFNYHKNKSPRNLPFRIYDKARRVLSSKNYVQRNWELQFLGAENDRNLSERLFANERLAEWVPIKLIEKFYEKFKFENPVFYSHSVSMLLTLSLFSTHFKDSQTKTEADYSNYSAAQNSSNLVV